MILEEETEEVFGHEVCELSRGSHKPILAACELCGEFRVLKRKDYHIFCRSCIRKDKNHPMFGKHTWNFGIDATEEAKVNMSVAMKGKTHTKEQNAQHSKAMKGKNNSNYGKHNEEASNYKGWKKRSVARKNAKRRELGHTRIYPVEEGEYRHHFTDEHLGGIPIEVHKKLSGYRRKKHRTLVLQWLKANDKKKYLKVLCVLATQ